VRLGFLSQAQSIHISAGKAELALLETRTHERTPRENRPEEPSMTARCHVCRSEDTRRMFQAPLEKFTKAMGRTGGVDYHFCNHCTVLFQYPIFDQAEYEKFYEKVQRSDETGYRTGEVPSKHLKKKRMDTAFKWNQLRLMDLERLLPGKRIFEVGPAEGTLLASFRDRGFTVSGVEPLAPYARYARDVYKLDVSDGYFDANLAAKTKADMVILDGVLEHLMTPFDMLLLIRKMISPDGILYMGGLPIAEFSTPYMANIAHITLWSRRSLAFALECAGFTPLNILAGRPGNRPAEWVCIAQACREPRDIEREQPVTYPAPDFDKLAAHWDETLKRYALADDRRRKYGPAYTLLTRTVRAVPGARELVQKFAK
jgi:hypothetical protein